jgi:hypothetical protein
LSDHSGAAMSQQPRADPREKEKLLNPCFFCGVEMGMVNSRQLCKKTYCENAPGLTFAAVKKYNKK